MSANLFVICITPFVSSLFSLVFIASWGPVIVFPSLRKKSPEIMILARYFKDVRIQFFDCWIKLQLKVRKYNVIVEIIYLKETFESSGDSKIKMLYVSNHIHFYPCLILNENFKKWNWCFKISDKNGDLTVGLWVVETDFSLRHHDPRKRGGLRTMCWQNSSK